MSPSKLSQKQLQAHAVLAAFTPAATLGGAVEHMGFVQADPIRAPARAQDLILRQRVAGYRAGDLERHYPQLGLEEGYLYAYGFLTRALWQLRHPPRAKGLTKREQRLLAAVLERGEVHPEQLQAEFGAARARNAWGGLFHGGQAAARAPARARLVACLAPPAGHPPVCTQRQRG